MLSKMPEKYTTGPLMFRNDGVPTYEECRQLIKELAYKYWIEGMPGSPEEHWLHAEWTLFLGSEYKVFVCYPDKPNQEFYEKWEVRTITSDIKELAIKAFGTKKAADFWMENPNPELGGYSPQYFVDTNQTVVVKNMLKSLVNGDCGV
jgi:hypothetical protein